MILATAVAPIAGPSGNSVDFKQLKAKVHNVALDARNLSRIVDSEAFARAWEAATEEQRRELERYVIGVDKTNVDNWVKRVLSKVDLNVKSFKELREIAKMAGIPYYNNKSKEELLEELKP